jgi:hypothetical protein
VAVSNLILVVAILGLNTADCHDRRYTLEGCAFQVSEIQLPSFYIDSLDQLYFLHGRFLYGQFLYSSIFIRSKFIRSKFIRSKFIRSKFIRSDFIRSKFIRSKFIRFKIYTVNFYTVNFYTVQILYSHQSILLCIICEHSILLGGKWRP